MVIQTLQAFHVISDLSVAMWSYVSLGSNVSSRFTESYVINNTVYYTSDIKATLSGARQICVDELNATLYFPDTNAEYQVNSIYLINILPTSNKFLGNIHFH